jgi:hypothetical protein
MKIHMNFPGLRRVISGGQTGSDQAGLWAARCACVETGGYIPKGWRTQAGPMPSLGKDYGLIEHSSPNYPPRTKLNAKEGDGTVRLASNFNSTGEKLTLKYCIELGKPHFDIPLDGMYHEKWSKALCDWIIDKHIEVLNVAGNSDKDDRAGFHFTEATLILTFAFEYLRQAGKLQTTDFC